MLNREITSGLAKIGDPKACCSSVEALCTVSLGDRLRKRGDLISIVNF